MPDIAMCDGKSCPRKHECYRHRAVPSGAQQAYFGEPPVAPDGSCNYFEPLRKGDALNRADGDHV